MAASETIGIDLLVADKASANLKKVSGGFANLDKSSKASAEFSTFAMAKAVAFGNLLSQGANTLFNKMGQSIPALGETLSQAGTVFFNNLFKPLSDILIPLLRDLMNWVRDNRTGFVQLGGVIAGVFRAFITIVTQVFKIVKDVFNKFFSAITGGAKASFGSVAQFLNFLLVKIVFVIQFLLIIIEPVIMAIADLIVWLGKNVVGPFIDGFVKGFAEMLGPMDGLIDAWNEFASVMKVIGSWFDGEGSMIKDFFKFAGKMFGAAVTVPLRMLKDAFIALFKILGAVGKGIIWLKEKFGDIGPAIRGAMSDLSSGIGNFFGNIINWVKEKWQGLIDWFSNIGNIVAEAFENAWVRIKEKIGNITGKIKNLFSGGSEKPEAMATATGGAVNNNSGGNVNAPITVNLNGPITDPEQAKAAAKQGASEGSGNIKAMQIRQGRK